MTHLGHNLTLPKYMIIKQTYQFQGYIPASSNVKSGYFDIMISDSNTPLQPGLSGLTDFTSSNNGTGVLLTGASLTETSQNYSYLNAIYPIQRVLKGKLSVCMIPQALTDSVNLLVTPYIFQIDGSSLPTASLPVNDMTQLVAPRCKNKQCVANVSSQSRNTMHYSIGINQLFGVTRQAVLTEDNYITTNGALNVGVFRIFWTTNDEVDIATNLPVHLKLTLITKFEGMNNTYQA